jgi:hypothetical protein
MCMYDLCTIEYYRLVAAITINFSLAGVRRGRFLLPRAHAQGDIVIGRGVVVVQKKSPLLEIQASERLISTITWDSIVTVFCIQSEICRKPENPCGQWR